MFSEIENTGKSDDYGLFHYFDDFDYPFHKVDITLFEKAVEDLILMNRMKKNIHEENI